MHTKPQSSGRQAGATWVAAVGAFLLVAAAAVFVAVRWQRLSDLSKLALVAGVTVMCLAGGRWMRRSLPATGDVLFHLGAFLLPVDLAAAFAHAGFGWRALVLAEGLLGVVVLGGLGRATGSVVLHWAAVVAVPVLAAGVAAFTPVPAPLLLAIVAVSAEVALSRHRPGSTGTGLVVWAALAGLAPLLGAASGLVAGGLAVHLGAGTLADLGLTAHAQLLSAPLAGALAAAVLANRARRRDDVRLAFAAMASVVVGVTTSLVGADLPPITFTLQLAAAFALIELVALALARDPFWSRPTGQAALFTEATVGLLLLAVAAVPLLDPWAIGAMGGQDWVIGLALGTAALAWLAADLRAPAGVAGNFWSAGRRPVSSSATRSSAVAQSPGLFRGGGSPFVTVAASACIVAGTAFATASGLAAALVMVSVSALAVAGRRPGAAHVAGLGALWALASASAHPLAGAGVGLAAALVAAHAAATGRGSGRPDGHAAMLLTASAVGTTVLAGVVVAPAVVPDLAVVLTAVALWLVALVLDRTPPGGGRAVSCPGDWARAAMLAPVLAGVALAPRQTLLGVCGVVALYVVDAVRLDRPVVGCGAALAGQGLLVQAAVVSELEVAEAGIALCVGAVVWGGLAAVVDLRWRQPFVVAAAAGLGVGVVLSTADPEALASTLMIAGALLAVAGLVLSRHFVGHGGGALVCGGLALHLHLAGVTALEPYLLAPALQSVVLGWQARRSWALSSWVAYGPAVVVLGGVALAQRLAGGGGGHALAAGTVGVVAVAVGGWRRLLGPLMAGTALLVVVTVNESLSALAGVPTWAWLATAGLVLLGVGVGMERGETSPADAGHRLVDVLSERYE